MITHLFNSRRRRLLALAASMVACSIARPATAYVPDDRWTVTAAGSTGAEGRPARLTWSIARDGTSIPGEGSSNLVSYLDGLFGVTAGGSDLTQRPWFTHFKQAFDRWSALGGITFTYEPNDNGTSLQTSPGVLGVRGDVRLGGAYIDGASGTLAYAWLPNQGDIVIDTGETSFFSNSSNGYRQLRNTIMHEVGHTLGLLHIESSTDNLLMEPTINVGIDGPQLDDIRGLHGLYGDAYEKMNNGLGNGTTARATNLGTLSNGGTLGVGSDAIGGQSVSPTETDFVSIANASDADFFSFSINAPALLDATLTPLGGIFNQGEEGGVQQSFNANARNDLTLSIFGTNGSTLLGSANLAAAGGVESLSGLALNAAGTYFARVTGVDDNVQLYQLLLSASSLATTLAGDFNLDGKVDAADYSLWRNTLGQIGANLAADGNGNGRVDDADYQLWKQNFGATGGIGSSGFGSVPEPGSLALLSLAAVFVTGLRRRNGYRSA